jgi:TorA maturation chaperone TorD
MMKKEMYTESVSVDKERMLKYKRLAAAFSYPDEDFFAFFPELLPEKERMLSEYDRLFRADKIWLYTTEYLAKNEFQKSSYLADIMGFYRAFGVEPDKDRPDSLSCELEFMHYLIFKRLHALSSNDAKNGEEKALICLDAEKKFFTHHLYPAALKIARVTISKTKDNFYLKIANEILEFLESEKIFLGRVNR